MLLVVETISWKPHIETAMEIALDRRAAGEDVVYCSLRLGLPACEDASPSHRLVDLPAIRTARAARVLRKHGVSGISPRFSHAEVAFAQDVAAGIMRQCASIEDLKRATYRQFHDVGWGAISSVVSLTRNASISLQLHSSDLRDYLAASILVYDRVAQLIETYKPSKVLLFNGRFATTRAVLRSSEASGIPWRIHERGGNKDRYWIADCMPHQMDLIQKEMVAQWTPGKEAAGHEFFQGRRNRVEREWHSFTLGQQVGHLPPPLAGDGSWVTFFTSSEDEMFAIGDAYASQHFPSQMDAIRATADAVRAVGGLQLCVRIHPHIAQKSQSDREKWANLGIPDVLVLGPEDPTDSYALIERSRVICTYGSTVGAEATYWGRPSLLFAPSYYDQLGICEIATDQSQIERFLASPTLFPQARTLPYGAFWTTLGQPYKYYRADDLHRGSICGEYLDDSLLVRVARAVQKPIAALIRLFP